MEAGAESTVIRRAGHCFAPVLYALLLCANARAEKITARCPWINEATAAGVLGGEVRMSVTNTTKDVSEQPNGAPGDATCEFVPRQGPPGAMLRIAVHTMKDHTKEYPALEAACGRSARRVVGVGNEAIACSLPTDEITKNQIIGRVRQRAFMLSVSIPLRTVSDSNRFRVDLDKLQNTAEQIAGALF